MKPLFRLTVSCADRPGLVAAVSGALARAAANIVEAQHFADPLSGRFFMRFAFVSDASREALLEAIAGAGITDLEIVLRAAADRQRIIILVSKFDHCLVDLLYRHSIGELDADIVAIVSNHAREGLGSWLPDHIPFYHLPITPESKAAQESRLLALIDLSGADLIVLARYMQVLSAKVVARLDGRCINIHHSFLPGFKGAKPYHQAHARGVKMIGATAHYVTSDLDEGPIIHQDVEPVSHSDSPEDMIRKGRDVERRVLAEAVRAHIEQRVLIDGARTIVFNN
jgi:formyltetrahydrofolate deformylase